jgi:hypothetical protein
MVGYAYRRDVGVPEDELGTCAECIVDPNRHASADLVPRGIGAQGGQDRMHIDISVKWRPRGSDRDAQVRRMPDLGARLVRVLEAAPHRCRREAFRVAPRPIFPLDPSYPLERRNDLSTPTTRERSRVTRLRTGTATSPRNGARRRSPDGISGGGLKGFESANASWRVWARSHHSCASPGTMQAIDAMHEATDARAIQPTDSTPTLTLQRTEGPWARWMRSGRSRRDFGREDGRAARVAHAPSSATWTRSYAQ